MDVNTTPAISKRALLLLLLLLTVGFRIVHLSADPPADFSWSGGYFADEGFWSHNARNSVLYGQPVRDQWDARIVSPVFAFFQQMIFRVFGPGLAQVRLIGIFSALLIAVASFLLFGKEYRGNLPFFFAVATILNYPMLVLARQGILDPFAAALCWAALALLTIESWPAIFLAGVLAVGSCITKYLMVYTFAPLLLALLYSRGRRFWPAFVSGSVVTIALWVALNYWPNQDLLRSYSRYYSSQQSWQIMDVARNVVLQPFYLYFIKTPAVLFFGNLALWYFLSRRRENGALEKICAFWLLAGILFFALWRYRPLRYYTSLALPLSALSIMAILRMREITEAMKNRPLLWFGASLPVLQMGILLFDRITRRGWIPGQLGIETGDVLLFLGLNAALLLIISQAKQKMKWSVVLFFLVFLFSDMRHYFQWMAQPRYSAREISADLQKRVGQGVLTGQWAPELCLENRIKEVPVWYGFVNTEKPFEKYGITHVLVWRYPLGGEKFEEWYPREFMTFKAVASYKIKDSDLVLYEKEGVRK